MSTFASLGVAPWLVSTLTTLGIKSPTEIQVESIPRILQGRDIIGKAKTGSGKTAAFALPILQTLARDPFGIYAIVLTPTRELAFQLAEQFRALGQGISLRDVVVVGGLDMLPQASALSKRPHVVIATPGRLADHLRSGTSMALSHTKFLVLDEVDRLMEHKFKKDLKTIADALPPPEKRQTLLFSATMTKDEVLSGSNQFDLSADRTDFVQVFADDDALVEQLDQRYLFMPQNIKEVYLAYLLSKSRFVNQSAIVFVSTCRGCEVVTQLLVELGLAVESLHSRKNQARRLAALGKFRSGTVKILVATDVASRGLDIPTVQLVLNYDLPRVSADYIHRVGRTARAGRGGCAISFVSQYDIEMFKSIEESIGTGKQMEAYELEESDVLTLLKTVAAAKRMAKIRLEDFELTSRVVKRKRKSADDDDDDDDGEQGDGGNEDVGGNHSSSIPAAAAATSSSSSSLSSSAASKPATKKQKHGKDSLQQRKQPAHTSPGSANGNTKKKKKKTSTTTAGV